MGHVTVADVVRIAASADPVDRNYQITRCYFDLSQRLSSVLGSGANWCTFATWASNQAGQTIRGEDLSQAVADRLAHSPELGVLLTGLQRALERLGRRMSRSRIQDAVRSAVDTQSVVQRVGAAVARGNLKVFEEIGAEFARFLVVLDGGVDDDRVQQFCAVLRPGDPPDGQRLLSDAFKAYAEAFHEADPKARAERMFFANLLVGLHEQTRLQPEISASMEVARDDRDRLRQRLLRAVLPGTWLRLRTRFARLLGRSLPLDVALDRLADHLSMLVRRAITEELLTLHFPRGRTLRLGRDLQADFPDDLNRLTRPELLALLAQVDPSPDSLAESGTIDWSDLPDRMHFITDLFRCFHAWDPLFDAPPAPA